MVNSLQDNRFTDPVQSVLYNLHRSASWKRTRQQSVLYNLHRSASSKSTRLERKQQLDLVPVQSSVVKDRLRWPAGAALLSSTRLDLLSLCAEYYRLFWRALLCLLCIALQCGDMPCFAFFGGFARLVPGKPPGLFSTPRVFEKPCVLGQESIPVKLHIDMDRQLDLKSGRHPK